MFSRLISDRLAPFMSRISILNAASFDTNLERKFADDPRFCLNGVSDIRKSLLDFFRSLREVTYYGLRLPDIYHSSHS